MSARVTRPALLAPLVASLACACAPAASASGGHLDPIERLPAQGTPPQTLRIGISPGTGMQRTVERAEPLREYLAASLRVPVELVPSRSNDEVLGLIEREQVHGALLSPLTYVRARRRLPVVPLASASSDGSPTYSGYFVVRESSPYRSLEELRGRTIVWVDSSSTSGYLYPRAMLRWHGYDPDHFFGRVSYAGDHWSAIQMVARGDADVAAVASSFVDPGRVRPLAGSVELRVVGKTARIPFDCFVVQASTPRSFGRRLRDALLSMVSHAEASSRLATSWGFSAFVATNEGRYDVVAEVQRSEQARSGDP